jgi:hypothetical protein
MAPDSRNLPLSGIASPEKVVPAIDRVHEEGQSAPAATGE